MKKIFAFITILVMLFSCAVLPVSAEETTPEEVQRVQTSDGTTVIYYDDGSTLTISPVQLTQISTYSIESAQKKLSANRVVTSKDSNGNLEWKYTLYGTFSYVPGVSSVCTDATYRYEINDDDWSFSDGNAIKSGNMAIGRGVFKLKFLFITTDTVDIDISLTCDIYGNIT